MLQPLTVVGFYGNGYLELVSHTLKKKASFGFMFATLQQDVLLMLSTTESLIVSNHEFSKYFRISINKVFKHIIKNVI